MYFFTVTDVTSTCSDTKSFSVGNPPTPPEVAIEDAPEYTCTGTNTGTYRFTVEGSFGVGGYMFTLDNPATTGIDFPAQSSTEFIVPAPTTTTGSVTYQLSISDTNCPGNTIPVTIDAVPQFTATLNVAASNLCATVPQVPDLTFVVDVVGEGPFSYQRVGVIGTPTPVTSITGNSGQFTITLPGDTRGAVQFQIFDANNNLTACPITIGDTINEPLITRTPVLNNPDCSNAPIGDVPTDGASITFETNGGSGAYTYEVFNGPTSTTNILGTTGVTDNITASPTRPTFTFSDAFDGATIRIVVTDDEGCEAPDPIDFPVRYPTAPVLAPAQVTPIACNGDRGRVRVIVTPNTSLPEPESISDFQYSFNGSTFVDSNLSPALGAGTVNYVVRNRNTGCTTSGSENLVEPTAVTLVNPPGVISPTCDTTSPTNPAPITPGSITLEIEGGATSVNQASYRYDYTITSTNPGFTIAPTQGSLSGQTDTITFIELDAGTYTITATLVEVDGLPNTSGCSETFSVTLPPQPFLEIVREQFDADTCAGGVDLYVVIDGGTQPENFEMYLDRISTIPINPSENPSGPTPTPPTPPNTPSDYIARFGNSDFTLADLATTSIVKPVYTGTEGYTTIFSQADLDARYFRFTGLPFGGEYRVVVVDPGTACESVVNITAPTATDLIVEPVVPPGTTGACTLNTGELTVTFSITDDSALLGDYLIQLQRAGQTDNPSESVIVNVIPAGSTPTPGSNEVTGTLVTSVPPTPNRITGIMVTLENLPEITRAENAIISVSRIGEDCNGVTRPVTVVQEPPVTPPTLLTNNAADCESEAFIQVEGNGGSGDFRFTLFRNGNTPIPDTSSDGNIFNENDGDIPVQVNGVPNPAITPATPAEILAYIPGPTDPPNSQLFGFVDVYAQDINTLCVSDPITVPIFLDPSPELALGTPVDECANGPYDVPFTITNYRSGQNYRISVNNGAEIITINETAASFSVTPASVAGSTFVPATAIGNVQVASLGRGVTYTLELSGNDNRNCDSTQSFLIAPALDPSSSRGAVNCDGEFAFIRVQVDGGFETATNRQLRYDLVVRGTTTPILATQTLSTVSVADVTDITFTNRSGIPELILQAGTLYDVIITDTFDPDVVPATDIRVCAVTEEVEIVQPLTLPTFTLSAQTKPVVQILPMVKLNLLLQVLETQGYTDLIPEF